MEPDEAVLKQYLLGELEAEQAMWVGRRLEENPNLAQALENLASDDTFLALFRGIAVVPTHSHRVEKFIERLKRLSGDPDVTSSIAITRETSTTAEPLPNEPTPADPVTRDGHAEYPKLKGYRIVRLVGVGGMGMVYEAADEKLNRQIALKVMKSQIASDSHARTRFLREAKAVACIEHDNVVPIYHIGEEDDVPFIAMPFLKGEALDQYLERSIYVPILDLVKIGRETAYGLVAIHTQGLVHRDLKPGNIWLERFGEDREWRVRILDFGLARSQTETDQITHAGGVVGTPAFMAPEQARGENVDVRADLFSLGSTLYLLATGRHPFGTGSVFTVLTALATRPPVPVRELNPAVPEQLAILIESLLEKSPNDRPRSAKDVAEKLRLIETSIRSGALPNDARTPNGECAEATISECVGPQPRRFRWSFLAGTLAVLGMLLGGAFAAYTLVFETKSGYLVIEVNDPDVELRMKDGELWISDQRGERSYTLAPSDRSKDLPPGEYRMKVVGRDGLELFTDSFKIKNGQSTTVQVTMQPQPTKNPKPVPSPGPEIPTQVTAPSAELLTLRKELIPQGILTAAGLGESKRVPDGLVGILGIPKPMHRDEVQDVAYSPNGRWLASASSDRTIILYDAETGVPKRTLLGHAAGVSSVAFTQDSATLVSAGLDGTLRLWPVEEDKKPEVIDLKLGPTAWLSMALSRDNKQLAVVNDSGMIRLWKFGEWKSPVEITDLEKKYSLRTVAFSPNGERLAVGGINRKDEQSDAFVFNTDTRKLDSTWPTEGRGVQSIKFSRDGKRLAIGAGPGQPRGVARVWDLAHRRLAFDVQQFRDFTCDLDLDPDANRLIVCNGEKGVVLFDIATQKPIASVTGLFGNGARSVTYSPDGKSVAFGTQDGGLQVWDAELNEQKHLDRGPRHAITAVAAKPDGASILVTTTENGLFRIDLCEPQKPRLVAQYRKALRALTYSPDGSRYAVAVGTYYWEPDTLEIRESTTDKLLFALKPPGFIVSLSFTPDAKSLLATGSFKAAVLYDVATGTERRRFPRPESLEVSHVLAADGKSVALCDRFIKKVTLLDLDAGTEIRSWATDEDIVPRVCAYDPHGKFLALGEPNNTIALWDIRTGKFLRTFSGHTNTLTSLRFTADGDALISTARDGVLRVWNPTTAQARAVLTVGPENQDVSFTLDRSGQFAFAAAHGGCVSILKLP